MSLTLRNSRLSLIAGQCFFEHHWQFSGIAPSNWAEYSWTFRRLRSGETDCEFAFPWRPSQRSAFWTSYLGGQPLDGVGPAVAWGAMVPLRIVDAERPEIKTDNLDERLFYDVYCYPHGLIVAMTVQSPRKASETLDAWRDRTRRLRLDQPYTVTIPGSAPRQGVDAGDALNSILDWHRLEYYDEVNEIYRSAEPFTVGAVIQGDGIDPAAPISNDLHRVLHAVTGWPRNWETVSLPKLADHCLPVRSSTASPGDALYASGRGRTLWRPGMFTLRSRGKAERLHTLSCLAHNLVAGAVHAESLRLFAQGYEASATARLKLNPDFARMAASYIDRLRRGERTYRSFSVARLIEDPNTKGEVNALLGRYGHPLI